MFLFIEEEGGHLQVQVIQGQGHAAEGHGEQHGEQTTVLSDFNCAVI